MEASQTFTWPDGQRCAVSLTYDDALPVHHQVVAPLLTARKFTATFNMGLLTFLWHHVESSEVEEDVVPVVFEASEPSG